MSDDDPQDELSILAAMEQVFPNRIRPRCAGVLDALGGLIAEGRGVTFEVVVPEGFSGAVDTTVKFGS